MKRISKVIGLAGGSLVFLTACGTGEVTASSTGLWDQIVYFFALAIRWLSFEGNIGIGIILFTILLRLIMLPLYHIQIKSSQKMQELQPKLKALQAKYPDRDTDSRLQLSQETQALYKESGINPYAQTLPMLLQLPILMALYQALSRVSFLRSGTFLWFELSASDPYFILPILAAAFTFLSSWLTNKAARERNVMMTALTYLMPIMIFFMGLRLASGLVLYWTVSNAFQTFQILLLNNPFKLIAQRLAVEEAEKERLAKIRRAKKKAQKRKR